MNAKQPAVDPLKLTGALLAGWYLCACASNPNFGHFIDGVDLLIHEAGHWIFIFFGEFMHILGGSLLQVLMPIIFVGYFFLRREYYSTGLMMSWVGYTIIMVAGYMNDAIVMRLPLLGGDNSIHDWNVLFVMTNQLSNTYRIAHVFLGIGWIVMICGIVCCLWFSLSKPFRSAILARFARVHES